MNSIDPRLDPRLREIASAFQTPPAASVQQSPAPPLQYEEPLQPYLQQTPGPDEHDGEGSQEGGANDPKRPRACEACRGLKVKCEPDPTGGPCRRCAKANRNCVTTAPSRKRQKKTDSRVAELEKKIDALTATLAQKSAGHASGTFDQNAHHPSLQSRINPYQQVTNGEYNHSPFAQPPESRGEEWAAYSQPSGFESRKGSGPPMVVAGQKRKHMDGREYSMASGSPLSGSTAPTAFLMESGRPQTAANEYADVVDKGLVTAEEANTMFQCYVEQMAPHMGAVVFPAGITAAEVRKNQPTLFLAILSASSGSNYPRLQKSLTKEVMSRYAQQIICNGEKTLELIQALHVSTLWYYPPEHFEELKFYQLIHIAAVMAIDIGIGKKPNKVQRSKPPVGLWRDHHWRRTPFPDPESIEARRAWLSCYFLCANAAMGLRRPNLIRWNSFMGECVEVLETSPEALPTDKSLCQWIRGQHIAEEVGTQFSMDDPGAIVSISDPKVQYALKGFERDLQSWREQLTPESTTPSLQVMEHIINLYIHEVALHVNHNVEEFKPPFTEDAFRNIQDETDLKPLSSAHVDALATCLSSINRVLETFLSFDVDMIRCLPIANFVRVAYAVVVLIKMYFSSALPNSELGRVIKTDDMKVEQYLDGLVEKFRAAAAEERSRPSAKFLMVLIMLKTWFYRQRESRARQPELSASVPNSTTSTSQTPSSNQARNGKKPDFSADNTSLQLLSEVATGNSGGQSRTESVGSYPASTNWQEQQASYPSYGPTAQYPMDQGYGSANIGGLGMGNIDPNLGLDLGYSMGDNLEQAMGLTLGAGDFGNYLAEGSFFGVSLDNMPSFESTGF